MKSPIITQAVWSKGYAVDGMDASFWRADHTGRLVFRWAYGLRSHVNGWEIDHIRPTALGGLDHISNLRPLNWQTNIDRNTFLRKYTPSV